MPSGRTADRAAVRALEERDREAWRPLWDDYNAFYRNTPSDTVTEATFSRLCARTDGFIGLAALDRDDQLVGIAHAVLHPSTWTIATYCYLEDLFVAESVRGQGLGRSMMEGVLQRAHERECRRVELDTEEHNETALALYGGFGFKSGEGEVGRRSLFLRHHVEE